MVSSDSDKLPPHSISNILLALRFNSNVEEQSKLFWNAFETVIFEEFPVLAQIKERLLQLGCVAAHLTGSGPTIYGLVKNAEDGRQIVENLRNNIINNFSKSINKDNKEVILDAWYSESIDKGVHILSSTTK
jgi:4-diphosphocytidyl-2-C-methyl-D-erythritol kinase